MPATKTSAFITAGKTRFFGTSLGSPGAGELPNSAMYWPSTAGWPSGDLANFQKHATLMGRNPDSVRLYQNNPQATTGVNGSAGAYGYISADWRDIANTGTILVTTFKYNSTNWGATADALNAAGSSSIKTDFNNIAQNLKRWHDDTGNTAPIKKILIGYHHEPSNDSGVPADYKRCVQAIYNYWRTIGLSDGPKPATGPGSAYAGTWYDMLEWIYVDIGYNFRTAAPANINCNNYYPGDGYMRWVFADFFQWGGGLMVGGGQAYTDSQAGKVPQPGRTINPVGHYNDAWKSCQTTADNLREWYQAGSGGFRDVLLGFGEFACSEDIDRFPIVAGSLSGSVSHVGIPHLKGDWLEGTRKWLRGETWTAPNSVNNVVAANITFGPLITMPIWWHSQAAGPRWWNSIPYQPGDTTGPSTSGAGAHYTFDAFNTLMNDTIFGVSSTAHTAPTINTFTGTNTAGGTGLDFTFDATAAAGDSAIVSYTYDFGDGSSPDVTTTAALADEVMYSYTAPGTMTVTLTVTDTNSLVDIVTTQVVPSTGSTAVTQFAGANLIQPGMDLRQIRFTYNPAITALETYAGLGGGVISGNSGSAKTLSDVRSAHTQMLTLNAATVTVTLPTAMPGMVLRVRIAQDSSGSRALTWAAGGGQTLKWPASTTPTQTATASHWDDYTFTCFVASQWDGVRGAADMS